MKNTNESEQWRPISGANGMYEWRGLSEGISA